MGWFASLFGARAPEPHACGEDFQKLYSGFVDALVDSMNAGAPAAAPTFGPQEGPVPLQHKLPAAQRLVALGDVHGDINKMMAALRGASLVDAQDRWSGGEAVLVQVGDQFDRGDFELPVLYALERLQGEAARAGGAVHVINGNHETMNIGGNFRYANRGASASFSRWYVHQAVGAFFKGQCACAAGWSQLPALETGPFGSTAPLQEAQACRAAAVQPGGLVTRRFMARHPMVLQVGSTVFVHGGLHPEHLDIGVEEINAQAQAWMFAEGGRAGKEPKFLRSADAVVWSREYSATDESKCNCDMLRTTLGRLGAERMVVGHTIQSRGVNTACDDLVVRVDVGMSLGCGNHAPEVLEILNDKTMFRIQQDGTRVPLTSSGPQWGQRVNDVMSKAAAAAAAL